MKILDEMLVAVPSYKRPQNVPAMQRLHENILWCLASNEEAAEYAAFGATDIIVCPNWTGHVSQLNCILDISEASGEWCVIMDDDVTDIVRIDRVNETVESVSLEFAVSTIYRAMRSINAHYGGPHTGAGFNIRNFKDRVHICGFMTTALVVFNAVECHERFDDSEECFGRADTEMCLRQVQENGAIARIDWMYAHHHFTKMNKDGVIDGDGGYTDTRTIESQMRSAKYLCSKYPYLVRPKADKPGQIRMYRNLSNFTDQQNRLYHKVNRDMFGESF